MEIDKCPICQEKNFKIVKEGKLFKTDKFVCNVCGAEIEIKGEKGKIIKFGKGYEIASSIHLGSEGEIDDLYSLTFVEDQWLDKLESGNKAALNKYFKAGEKVKDNLPVILKAGEKLALIIKATSYAEMRRKRIDTPYSGITLRVAKGVSYRLGSVHESEYSDALTVLDKGDLYITSKRYLFIGKGKNIDQNLSKITSIEYFNDGLSISRTEKQRNDMFLGGSHWYLVNSLLKGLIKLE